MTAAQRSALTGVLLLLLRGLHVHAGIFSSGSRRVLDTQSPSSECIGTDPHIQRYLTSASTTSVDEKFFVQGWRWHTMSLIREARRLHQHAERLENENNCSSNEGMTALHTVADYCVNFNMRGLHKIEKDLFFPWVRVKTKAIDNAEISQAFDSVLDKLEQDRRSVESLGKSLMKQASIAADSSVSPHNRARAVGGVASDAAAIALTAENMLKCEDTTVVPAIARLVSEKEQKSFNTRVIRTLGLFDSRLHLVGMHEAILDSSAERKLFQETIPSIPQRMIPRWKRLLYDPRAGALDYV